MTTWISVAGAVALAASAAGRGQGVDPNYAAVLAAEAEHLGDDAALLIRGEDLGAMHCSGDARRRIVPVDARPFARAVRVEVAEATKPAWKICLTSPWSAGAIRKGDVLFGTYRLRGEAGNEAGVGHVQAYLQKPRDGWVGLVGASVRPGPTWRQRYFHTVAERDFPKGSVNLVFHLGGVAQTVEVGGLAVWNLGPRARPETLPITRVTYRGRQPDAAWRAAAAASIDKHRKADLTVGVIGPDGRGVPGATVRARLTRHAFGFGTFVEIHTPIVEDGPDAKRFRDVLTAHFNRTTCAVYPADGWGWPNPAVRRKNLQTIRWAKSHGFQVRAHTVLWPGRGRSPGAWAKLSGDALQRRILAHVEEVMGHMERLGVDEVDLVNEARGNTDHEKALGRDAMAAWFKTAKRVAPSVRIGINEYGLLSAGGVMRGNHEHYESLIRELRRRGAPIEVIGMQAHISREVTELDRVRAVLDRFAKLGLAIHVTELTVDTRDERLQADYLRDLLTVLFAHPAVEAVTVWGFWQGKIWLADSALWRKDWTIKPAGRAWVDLVSKRWATDATADADAAGRAVVRGFLGDYTVTVRAPGHAPRQVPASLVRGGAEVTVRLGPAAIE